jgi:predicted permease
MSIDFTVEGRQNSPGTELGARASVVSANFFHALQLPLLRGRTFTPAEDEFNSPPVIMINKALADQFFPGQDPLNQRIASGLSSLLPKPGEAASGSDRPQYRQIVGIVANTTRNRLDEAPEPEYYIPFAQVPVGPPVFALRVVGDPAQYTNTLRALVAQIDPSLPLYQVRTNLLARSTSQQRFQTQLLTAFALIALLLAAIGLYSVLSYMVTQRTQELGLRMALGAQRSHVLTLVLKRGLTFAIIGLTLGLGASALLTKSLTALLYHTEPLDLATFATTTALLLAISVLACLAPAYRASRLDPNETLRQQ